MLFGLIALARADDVIRNTRHMGSGVLGFFLLVLGAIALAGGIFAILRKVWGFALAGAICAIFSPGWINGILATIFVSISKDEFGKCSPDATS